MIFDETPTVSQRFPSLSRLSDQDARHSFGAAVQDADLVVDQLEVIDVAAQLAGVARAAPGPRALTGPLPSATDIRLSPLTSTFTTRLGECLRGCRAHRSAARRLRESRRP